MARNVARTVDFGPPHRISDSDLDAICADSKIKGTDRQIVIDFLNEAVAVFRDKFQREQTSRSRKANRTEIENAIKSIWRAQGCLTRYVGTDGQRAIRVAGREIAPALTAAWMRQRLPQAPPPMLWPPDQWQRSDGRELLRPAEADKLSLSERIAYMEAYGSEGITALLTDIAQALDVGRRTVVHAPVGRKPLKMRDYMLAALAELWHRLGLEPKTGVNSQFGILAEQVFDAIGWPTDGVKLASAVVVENRR